MTTVIKSKNPTANPKFFNFLNKESMIDCTLVADGHMMNAHKIVLAASSTYFEEIFSVLPDKHPAIILNDVPYTHLQMLMEFIYCGKVNVKETELVKFNKTLKNLRIEAMSGGDGIKKEVNDDDVIEIKEELDEDDDDSNLITELHIKEDGEIPDYGSSDGEYLPPSKRKRVSTTAASGSSSDYAAVPFRLPGDPAFQKRRIRVEDVIKSEEHKMWFDLRPEICPFCSKKAKTNKHRNEHVKYCTENPDRIVSQCPFCNKSFCDPYYVRKHCKNIHADMLGLNSSDVDHDEFANETFQK